MDNSSEVVTKIAGLYAERLLSDVVLVVGKQELPAHRLILCASSDVFQASSRSTNRYISDSAKFLGGCCEYQIIIGDLDLLLRIQKFVLFEQGSLWFHLYRV